MELERHLPDIAIAAALAWGSGLRAYAVIFAVGLAGALGWLELPGHLRLLEHPLVLGASGLMTAVEFFADKLPWLDSVWDAVHSFIRIPAGAALAAAVFGDSGAAVALAAAILGGTLSAGVHFAKAGTRAAINASPEPVSNWTASLAEDAMVPVGLWLAIAHPLVFFMLLAAFVVGAALVLRLLWRALRRGGT
ncbi:MAG TPA: DUF4126 domain-containing protein [Burkholderiales bacterium]|nr:DUF4126 domain-containing protein [Burkholderiales bacterium]